MRIRAAQIGADIAKLALAAQRQRMAVPGVLRSSEIADRTARRDHLRRGNDGISVYAIIPVQLVNRSGLTEMLDPERPNAVAIDRAKPSQCRGVSVQDRDDTAMPRQTGQ
jgi:hypothetical protein